jgi:protein-disulfide isomerase
MLVNQGIISRRGTAVCLAIGLWVGFGALGCNQQKAEKAADKPAAAATGAAGGDQACTDYAARLCKETGNEFDTTCVGIKTTMELMAPEACAVALKNVDHSLKKFAEKKKTCDELQDKLCKDLGPTTKTCEMVKTHTKTFPPERCDMMMKRYPEVLADLKKQEEKNKPVDPAAIAKLTAGSPPAFGPKDAKVTLVEFSDFQCPYCSRAATAVSEIKKKYGDKVHFVFRQFPLSFHQNAHIAAQASLAAHAQGKFWQFHDKLFENQQKLDRAALEGYAKELGLDMAAFKKALDDKTYAAAVDAEMKLGEEVAVDGTPTMFLNGARVSNPSDAEAIGKEIEAALKAAG